MRRDLNGPQRLLRLYLRKLSGASAEWRGERLDTYKVLINKVCIKEYMYRICKYVCVSKYGFGAIITTLIINH